MIKWKGASRACQTVVESPRGWWRHPHHPLSAQVSILNHPSRSSIPVQDDGPRLQRVDHCLRGDRTHLRSHRQELEARPPLQVRNKIIYVLLFCYSYDMTRYLGLRCMRSTRRVSRPRFRWKTNLQEPILKLLVPPKRNFQPEEFNVLFFSRSRWRPRLLTSRQASQENPVRSIFLEALCFFKTHLSFAGIVDFDNKSVTLRWNKPTDTGGRPITHFIIQVGPSC